MHRSNHILHHFRQHREVFPHVVAEEARAERLQDPEHQHVVVEDQHEHWHDVMEALEVVVAGVAHQHGGDDVWERGSLAVESLLAPVLGAVQTPEGPVDVAAQLGGVPVHLAAQHNTTQNNTASRNTSNITH